MDRVWDLRELLRDFAFLPEPTVTENDLPHLHGRVYLVTGASSGIGFCSAKFLAQAGAKVYITGRTQSRLDASLEKIRIEHPRSTVVGLLVDYNKLETIQASLEPLLDAEERLDGIIHNAGMNHNDNGVTEYGFVETLVVNVLGPQIVQTTLDPLIRETATSVARDHVRIVWVSSSAHFLAPECGGIDWDDLNNPHMGGLGYVYYGQTKAFNIYQAVLWGHKYRESGIVSVAIHPGIITSDIRRNTPQQSSPYEYFCRPTEYGAYAELHPLFMRSVTSAHNGAYYVPFGQRSRIRQDIEQAAHGPRGQKVWHWLESNTDKYMS